jgi:hypothetical protein
MRAAFIGFAIMLIFGASGSAAARAFILDTQASSTPAVAPAAETPDTPLVFQGE